MFTCINYLSISEPEKEKNRGTTIQSSDSENVTLSEGEEDGETLKRKASAELAEGQSLLL